MQRTASARRRNVRGWAFSTPYVAFLLAFGIVPAVWAIVQSLQPVMSPGQISLANYFTVFNDFRFLPAALNVLTFMAIWIPVMVLGTLIFALLLHHRASRSGATQRLVYFLPGAVTGSAAVMLWYFMISPELSPWAPALHAMGFEHDNQVFTTSNLTARREAELPG